MYVDANIGNIWYLISAHEVFTVGSRFFAGHKMCTFEVKNYKKKKKKKTKTKKKNKIKKTSHCFSTYAAFITWEVHMGAQN